jgi:hypothetical protein
VGTVVKFLASALIQKTHPAGALPVRPSPLGVGVSSSSKGAAAGALLVKVIAIGACCNPSALVNSLAKFPQVWVVIDYLPLSIDRFNISD